MLSVEQTSKVQPLDWLRQIYYSTSKQVYTLNAILSYKQTIISLPSTPKHSDGLFHFAQTQRAFFNPFTAIKADANMATLIEQTISYPTTDGATFILPIPHDCTAYHLDSIFHRFPANRTTLTSQTAYIT